MLRIAVGIGRLVTVAAFLAAFVTVATLAAISHSGHQLFTVISGSMTPTFVAGDTVLVRPVEPDDLQPGMVVTFHAPGEQEHLTTHRILTLRPMESGLFVQTKGDANEDADPNFTAASNVVGEVTDVLPAVGHWLMFFQSQTGRIAVLGTPLLLIAFGQLVETSRDLALLRHRRSLSPVAGGRRTTGPSPVVTVVAAVAVTAVAGVGGVALGRTTGAVYAATASSSANTFSTALFCGQGDYATAVLLDRPQQYHKLNETTGNTAADSSGNGDSATYQGTKTLGVAGAVCGGTTAVRLGGTNAYVANTNYLPTLTTAVTVEAWVQTTGDGVVAALDALIGTDRVLYVGNDGRAYFTSGGTVSSPGRVNDGRWHHIVATGSGSTLAMYVDGVPVATATASQGTSYLTRAQYGYANLSAAATASPATDYLTGSLDEVAVYSTALPASRVLAHYRAGGGS